MDCARWASLVTQMLLKETGNRPHLYCCINCILKKLIREGRGRISRDLKRGSVCAECLTFEIILMAAFCFLNSTFVEVGEPQLQICIPYNTPSPCNRYSYLDVCFISGPCLLISSLGSIRESQITGSGLQNELNFWFLAVNANPNPILCKTRSSACILFVPNFLFLMEEFANSTPAYLIIDQSNAA